MIDRVGTVQLVHSGEEVPWNEAYDAASDVYSEFMASQEHIGHVAKLSFLARQAFEHGTRLDEPKLENILGRTAFDTLEWHYYIRSLLKRASPSLELKARVAISMVASQDGVDSSFEEPFTAQLILPSLRETRALSA